MPIWHLKTFMRFFIKNFLGLGNLMYFEPQNTTNLMVLGPYGGFGNTKGFRDLGIWRIWEYKGI